jgi:translocation and assembly module TamA
MIAARLEEDAQLVRTLLASEGWYDPQVSTRIELGDGEGEPLRAVIDVAPGQRFVFGEIRIDAPPTQPAGLIDENLALKVGEPIIAERVQGAEAQIAVTLPERGYPFVEIGQRDILLDRDTGDGAYTLPIDTGPRSVFGGFATEGDLAFDAEHVDVLARFERGELYDSRKVDDLRKALVATGLFSTVAVEPLKTGEAAGDGAEYVTVMVEQDAGPPRTIAGTAGYGTGEGFRVEASWTHRNMFPPEGALIASAVAGTKEQGAGVTFRRSNAGKRDRTFELVAEVLHSQFDAYSAYTGRLAGQISYESTPIWQKRFTYSFGFELLATAERDFDFDLGRRDRKTYYIGGINGRLGLDYTDDLLDPTEGFRLSAFVRPEGSLQGGFNAHVKTQIDSSGYLGLGNSFVLAGRLRLGSIQGADRDEIAPSRRFYAGGGGSVRGFAYQKLGQLDPNGDPIGGRSLNEASVEGRYRFGNFGVVGFVDVGQSYTDKMPQFSDLRYGVGIGGRYYTNFGPLRVDVATPLDRRPGESRINVYVSIGQAF